MEFVQVRFKELREQLGMSQREIALKLNMKQPAWARLEAGGVPDPRTSTIAHICKTFDVDANWLLGMTDNIIPLCQKCHEEIEKTADLVKAKGLENDAFIQEQLLNLGKRAGE